MEVLRLSKTAKDQLLTLKRRTGIQHWNVLCRWALCRSLAEASTPPDIPVPADSNVEMTWKVFSGEYGDLFVALMRDRCARDGVDTDAETVARFMRLHVHRGVGYMFGDSRVKSIDGLVALASPDLA